MGKKRDCSDLVAQAIENISNELIPLIENLERKIRDTNTESLNENENKVEKNLR